MIREEVERNVRWSAGFHPGGVGKGNGRPAPLGPLPGLDGDADDELEDKEYGEEEKEQQGAKASSTLGGEDR